MESAIGGLNLTAVTYSAAFECLSVGYLSYIANSWGDNLTYTSVINA